MSDPEQLQTQLNVLYQIERNCMRPSHDFDALVRQARDLIQDLDGLGFFYRPDLVDTQVRALTTLQQLAYSQQDDVSVVDITNWCLQRWLWILNYYPEDARIMHGIGSWWLAHAQSKLASIYAMDGGSSSDGGQSSRPTSFTDPAQPNGTNNNIDIAEAEQHEAIQAAVDSRQSELRMHTADYVEVRGHLLAATDYLCRAVETAESGGAIEGILLVTAAEAYMHLGNVSSSRTNMAYFRQAIHFLRQASTMPDFELPQHLQRYLEDYGRFVD